MTHNKFSSVNKTHILTHPEQFVIFGPVILVLNVWNLVGFPNPFLNGESPPFKLVSKPVNQRKILEYDRIPPREYQDFYKHTLVRTRRV